MKRPSFPPLCWSPLKPSNISNTLYSRPPPPLNKSIMASPIPNQRHPKLDDPHNTAGSSASSNNNLVNNSTGSTSKRKWTTLMPFLVALVVISQIAFLGRLDMSKNTELINTWADSFYQFTSSSLFPSSTNTGPFDARVSFPQLDGGCEVWLEKQDSVNHSRDFHKEPILVTGDKQELMSCSVGCKIGYDSNRKPDAAIGLLEGGGIPSVLRSMESSQYYAENNIDIARRRGYSIVMTTSLSSDVPVGYFSWAEYDIMAPVQPKSEDAIAAAFISNCGARNFRLQALEALERANIKIDSYGSCHRNRNDRVDKVEALKRYKFSLAFENSNEEDYVTEKFFQSLVAGSVPVVVGAPNIQDFAPSPGSVLHIKELKDADFIAEKMKYLAKNPDAYNESLRWKFEGPTDSFKALVDMAAVHSSCRLCIFMATKIREKEEKSPEFKNRPCKCTRGVETVYHAYVRERGRFVMESIFLRSGNLTMEALEFAVLSKFKSMKHVPIWKHERPEKIRGRDELKVYRIYPLELTQRQALFTFRFNGNTDFRQHIEKNPCPKFEVIFV